MAQSPATLAGHFSEEFLSESVIQDASYNPPALSDMMQTNHVGAADLKNVSGKLNDSILL